MKEYQLLTIKNVTYTNRRIIYQKGLLKKVIIPYDDIVSYYICIKPRLCYLKKVGIAKYLVINTKNKKRYSIYLGIMSGFLFIGDFEEQHVSFMKKMVPNAKYLKKVPLSKRIEGKLKKINSYIYKDD